MKKLFAVLVALVLALPVAAVSESAAAALQDMYAQAELLMVQGDYSVAAAKFDALGTYSDAAQMAMYCKAIAAAESLHLYDLAADTFVQLGQFKDSPQMARYYSARRYQYIAASFDAQTCSDTDLDTALSSYREAIAIYSELALYKDSLARITDCQSGADVINTELSRRKNAEKAKAYQRALALENAGSYQEAIVAYEALGSYQDCAARIAACQGAILEGEYQHALSLENSGSYEAALAAYEALGSYRDCTARIAACKEAICEADYRRAVSLEDSGSFAEAYDAYNALAGYKDSASRSEACWQHLRYSSAEAFSGGLACVYDDQIRGWGYINTDCELVIPCEWSSNHSFSDGLAVVYKRDEKYGAINTKGELVIPLEWDSMKDFSEGLAAVEKNGKWGFVDTNGKLVVPCKWEYVGSFSEGYAAVKRNGKWGYIDTKGNEVLPCKWHNGTPFNSGLANVSNSYDPPSYYINAKGKVIFTSKYDLSFGLSEGLAAVKKQQKWGFVDTKGTLVIPIKYRVVRDFSEGYAAVYTDKAGFIDKTGKTVIPFVWDDAFSFSDGMAMVRKNKGWGYIDTEGTVVIPPEYSQSKITYSEGYFTLIKDGVFTIVDREELQPGYRNGLSGGTK